MLALADTPVAPVTPDLSFGPPLDSGSQPQATTPTWLLTVYKVALVASVGISTYHGYKRNHSVGWAIGWGLLGGLFPVIVPAIAIAQGLGKRKA